MFFILTIILLIFVSIRKINISKTGNFSLESSIVLRGILVLLVIFHHIPLHSDYGWVNIIHNSSGRYAVTLFFFMSGYGLTMQYTTNPKKFLCNFILRRFSKLLVPYFIAWGIFFILSKDFSFSSFLSRIKNGDNIIPFAYFVEELAILYLLHYISFKFFNGIFSYISIFILTLFMMSCFYSLEWNYHWWISSLGFPMGALIYKARNILCRLNVLSFSIIIACTFFSILTKQYTTETVQAHIFALSMVPSTCLLFSMIFPSFTWAKHSPLIFFGKISYETYLFQGLALIYLSRNINEATCFIITILCIIIGFIFHIIDTYLIKKSFQLIAKNER